MRWYNKKALSAVVTTLILILLVIVAIGIVWVVIKNILSESSEEISAGLSRVTLEIIEDSVKINNNDNTLSFVVSRDIGKGDLNKIKVILKDTQDNTYSEEVDVSSLTELGTKRITINKGGLTMIKSISIAPVIKTEKGKEKLFAVADEIKFSNEEVIKNMPGIVAWWRFEGNAKDSVGNNHGSLNGGVSFTDGRFGKAASFDGVDDYVNNISFNPSFSSDLTIVAWIKSSFSHSYQARMIDLAQSNNVGLQLSMTGDGRIGIDNTGGPSNGVFTADSKNDGNWHQITVIREGSSYRVYVDGELIGSTGRTVINYAGIYIGSRYNVEAPFNGFIDEVIIFNRVLNEEEIDALYEINL